MPHDTIDITVIMVDGSFREAHHAPRYFADQTIGRDRYEFLWCEYFGAAHPDLHEAIDPHDHMRIITLGRSGLYHSSYCFNAGITEARGKLIVIPDGDVVVEPDFLERLWQDHQRNDQLVEYCHRHNEPAESHRDDWDINHLRQACQITNPKNHGACLSVRKKHLLAINGYDQSPLFATGFHANDQDVYMRLRNLGLDVRWSPDIKLYHPWHPMTGEATPHYQPQLDCIYHRGQTLETLPFEGIDSSKDRPTPERYMGAIEWARVTALPWSKRAQIKLRNRLDQLLGKQAA